MHNLIISEKNITARKIADILSSGKFKTEKHGKHPVYTWTKNGDTFRCFGLRGHILKVDFPEEYANWQKVELEKLVTADVEKKPIEKSLVNLIKKEARTADVLVIATDFDREGELIGNDALNIALKENPKLEVKRARFSAITREEIQRAFSHLEKPYHNLAMAGETRQVVDLVWGATLTRFLSLSTGRLGKSFLSVGRVQSPTLALIVQREKEILEFKPETYYQIQAVFRKGDEEFTAIYEVSRISSREQAEEIKKQVERAGSGVVAQFEEKENVQRPPSPFNTTEFLAASSRIGISPGRAMAAAESLYTAGFISYPRVDNTVYPPSINFKSILRGLSGYDGEEFRSFVSTLLGKGKLTATRGRKEATDHPPIHPTGQLPDSLDAVQGKVYDLVARRFVATLSPPAKGITRRAVVKSGEHGFIAAGFTYTELSFLTVYPWVKNKEIHLPRLSEGEQVKLVSVEILEKQTQPRGRYTQSGLIREMERLGLGTKSTRHSIIQTLYDRGYIHGNPIQPTQLGMSVGQAILDYIKEISTPDMTAELEKGMDMVEEGKTTKDTIIDQSRQQLLQVLKTARENEEKIKEVVWKGVDLDRTIGPCPGECSGMLVIKRSKNKKRFLGCTEYKNGCRVSFPLPQKGTAISAGEVCQSCGTPKVKIISRGRKPWIICPNPQCEENAMNSKEEKAGGE